MMDESLRITLRGLFLFIIPLIEFKLPFHYNFLHDSNEIRRIFSCKC